MDAAGRERPERAGPDAEKPEGLWENWFVQSGPWGARQIPSGRTDAAFLRAVLSARCLGDLLGGGYMYFWLCHSAPEQVLTPSELYNVPKRSHFSSPAIRNSFGNPGS